MCVAEFFFSLWQQISECVLFLTCELIEEKLVSIEITDIWLNTIELCAWLEQHIIDTGVSIEHENIRAPDNKKKYLWNSVTIIVHT